MTVRHPSELGDEPSQAEMEAGVELQHAILVLCEGEDPIRMGAAIAGAYYSFILNYAPSVDEAKHGFQVTHDLWLRTLDEDFATIRREKEKRS